MGAEFPSKRHIVRKFINGRWYLYQQKSWRENGRARYRSIYVGPADCYVHPRKIGDESHNFSMAQSRSIVVGASAMRGKRIAVLSKRNCELLNIIAQTRPASLQELAERSGRRKSNLSRTLKTMERHGLIRLERIGCAVAPRILQGAEAASKDLSEDT